MAGALVRTAVTAGGAAFQGDGMRGRVLAVTLTLATLIGALPVAGSLWIAWENARRVETDLLIRATREMLTRSERLQEDATRALAAMAAVPC